jgi:hypothetical protein
LAGWDGLRFGGVYPSYAQIGKYEHLHVEHLHVYVVKLNRKGFRWQSNFFVRNGQNCTVKKLYGTTISLIRNGTPKKRVDGGYKRLTKAYRKAVVRS